MAVMQSPGVSRSEKAQAQDALRAARDREATAEREIAEAASRAAAAAEEMQRLRCELLELQDIPPLLSGKLSRSQNAMKSLSCSIQTRTMHCTVHS